MNPAAAPSFAEAFFARGVSNLVCTAWPIGDRAARVFALVFYSRLLGLPLELSVRLDDINESVRTRLSDKDLSNTPQPIFRALRDARWAIFSTAGGAGTWGAYQHYGSPYMRFFQ